MPIVQIQALPQRAGVSTERALTRICAAVASELGCEPRRVWATWATIEPGLYVEGDTPAHEQPGGTHPPIARLLAFEGRDQATIERALLAVSTVLADELGLEPGAPFVHYEEAAAGRVCAGGKIERRTS